MDSGKWDTDFDLLSLIPYFVPPVGLLFQILRHELQNYFLSNMRATRVTLAALLQNIFAARALPKG